MNLRNLKAALRTSIEETGIRLLPSGDPLSSDFEGIVVDINYNGSSIKSQVRNMFECVLISTFLITFSLKAPTDDISAAEDIILDEIDKLKVGFPLMLVKLNQLTSKSNDIIINSIDAEVLSQTESSDTFLAATISLSIVHKY